MSAFVMSDESVSRLAQGIVAHCERHWKYPLDLLAHEVPETFNATCGAVDAPSLALAMHRLNVYAVEQRYHEGQETTFRFTWNGAPLSDVALFKSLQCWHYQCAEGDADEKPLYRILERVAKSLASHIISGLPQYATAKWS